MGSTCSVTNRKQGSVGKEFTGDNIRKMLPNPTLMMVKFEYVVSQRSRLAIEANWKTVSRLQKRFFDETHREVFKARPNLEGYLSNHTKMQELGDRVENFLELLIRKHLFRKPYCDLDCQALGLIHSNHLYFGVKSSFVDIWIFVLQRNLSNLPMNDSQRDSLKYAWRELIYYIVREMAISYEIKKRSEKLTAVELVPKTSNITKAEDID